jgi:peptidoglycan-associated lipoprotein
MTFTKIGLGLAMVFALAACDKVGGPFGKLPKVGGSNGGISTSNLDPNSVEYFQQTIGDRVLFVVDQSSITAEGFAILDKQSEWLAARPNVSVLIEGHADEQGTREYNLALGARRAAAVQSYLASKGVADSRLRTVTFGKERPLEICSTEECWSKTAVLLRL